MFPIVCAHWEPKQHMDEKCAIVLTRGHCSQSDLLLIESITSTHHRMAEGSLLYERTDLFFSFSVKIVICLVWSAHHHSLFGENDDGQDFADLIKAIERQDNNASALRAAVCDVHNTRTRDSSFLLSIAHNATASLHIIKLYSKTLRLSGSLGS